MEIRRSALLEISAEEIFDIIEGAEHYPEFLPGCESVTILERTESVIAARVAVAWKGLRFEFTTRNPKRRPEWLAVRLQRGREAPAESDGREAPAESDGREAPAESDGREAPAESKSGAFRTLEGEWNLRPLSSGACKVEFSLRCELQGAVAKGLAGWVIDRFADALMDAYVARARSLRSTQPA